MIVPIVVLDTSVIVKWVRQEEVLAREALCWRSRFLDGEVQFAVPFLLAYELANVLVYKPDLSTEQVQAALQSLFDMGIDWIEPSPPLLLRSTAIAREHDLSVYDATFVALAEALQADLITADERLVHGMSSSPYIHFLGR